VICEGGTKSKQDCTIGHYCPQGASAPFACTGAQYQDATGQSSCKTCYDKSEGCEYSCGQEKCGEHWGVTGETEVCEQIKVYQDPHCTTDGCSYSWKKGNCSTQNTYGYISDYCTKWCSGTHYKEGITGGNSNGGNTTCTYSGGWGSCS